MASDIVATCIPCKEDKENKADYKGEFDSVVAAKVHVRREHEELLRPWKDESSKERAVYTFIDIRGRPTPPAPPIPMPHR